MTIEISVGLNTALRWQRVESFLSPCSAEKRPVLINEMMRSRPRTRWHSWPRRPVLPNWRWRWRLR